MKTKHFLGLLLVLAVACKSEHPSPTAPVVGGTGGVTVGGGSNGDAGGAALTGGTGGTAVSVPARGTGGAVVTGGAVGSAGLTAGAAGTVAASSTGGTKGDCTTVDACVGDAVGNWRVMSSCLWSSGRSDISMFGLPCATAEITGTVSVTGSLVLTAAGRYTDKTVTTGSEAWVLQKECLQYWEIPVTCEKIGTGIRSLLSDSYEDFTCADAPSGGGCTCQGTINQSGGLGVLYNDIYATGKYALTGGILTLGDVLTYSSCVANGSRLTLSPLPALGARPSTGSIVFGKTEN